MKDKDNSLGRLKRKRYAVLGEDWGEGNDQEGKRMGDFLRSGVDRDMSGRLVQADIRVWTDLKLWGRQAILFGVVEEAQSMVDTCRLIMDDLVDKVFNSQVVQQELVVPSQDDAGRAL